MGDCLAFFMQATKFESCVTHFYSSCHQLAANAMLHCEPWHNSWQWLQMKTLKQVLCLFEYDVQLCTLSFFC